MIDLPYPWPTSPLITDYVRRQAELLGDPDPLERT
ncbi:hypothetical protein ALICE_230 [Mycobacterium phage Alice]|uniref:Uncharacterized protein n=3 Tax=Bixzunavirus TaxID=680114 RepID=A0A411AZG7_9CAUD|nr:hypothetical protein HYRO_229 [Mycobacterium phage HyRo]YP_009216465.1 hypothetical protein ALICE_230 [Mycobacterium phage Alice]AXN54027.1 hypothetical protein SEA_RABINOVISH_237 [Mycobacterium phage Rabinovish]QAX93510.1 hypothetical protein SEA_STUBBY_227 [Mycobacterium phage Stubby]QAY10032.1 hypothetical protein PBI_FLABSLAB_238 [Mycobacterium phage Flabslab]UEM46259.1 hypothetical protein SEA_PINKCREEK_224 [Mycobacterium phage Pinkcreek]AEJ94483.1 hypothetical protein ALICE_230 [Myco